MVTLTARYEGGLRCQAVHGPSGATLLTDAPVDNHGRGESFSPTDLVATAVGTCMMTIMGIVADRHGIDLTGMTAETTKQMSTSPPRRIVALPTRIGRRLEPRHAVEGALPTGIAACGDAMAARGIEGVVGGDPAQPGQPLAR